MADDNNPANATAQNDSSAQSPKTVAQADLVKADDATSSVVAVIEKWWSDHFHGSPIATNTEHYNYAYQAKEELKRLLSKFTQG